MPQWGTDVKKVEARMPGDDRRRDEDENLATGNVVVSVLGDWER